MASTCAKSIPEDFNLNEPLTERFVEFNVVTVTVVGRLKVNEPEDSVTVIWFEVPLIAVINFAAIIELDEFL